MPSQKPHFISAAFVFASESSVVWCERVFTPNAKVQIAWYSWWTVNEKFMAPIAIREEFLSS
jgi:hypothetical protein